MASVTHPRLFSQKEPLIEAWYWIEYSSRLKRGKTKAVSFFGKDLVLYREQGKAGHLFALDAYCPHMGAHLAEGKVEGEHLRCFFHHWKFEGSGACIEIPIQKDIPTQACVSSWPVQEKYGLIWLWPSTTPATELPKIPELEEEETDYLLGNFFLRNCHPHVVMINAIDEQHFYSVHPLSRNLAGGVRFEVLEKSPYNIQFRNETSVPETTFFTRLLKRFYRDSLTYWMSYWHGCIGSVIVGPDFLHFYILFALRPTLEGKTEGQTVLLTKKRRGFFAFLFNRMILCCTYGVVAYFAQGDTRIFRTIRFQFKTPLKGDHSVIRFIQHLEGQKTVEWPQSNSENSKKCLEEKVFSSLESSPDFRIPAGKTFEV